MATPDLFDFDAASKKLKADGKYVQNITVKESVHHNACITLRKNENGTIKAQAEATDKDYLIKKENTVKRVKTCKYLEQLPRVVGQLATRAARDADNKISGEGKNGNRSKSGSITTALTKIVDKLDPNDFADIEKSFPKAKKYLIHTIAPYMDEVGKDIICDADMGMIFWRCVRHAFNCRRGKQTADGDKLPKDIDIVTRGQITWWRMADRIYRRAREINPDALPDVRFPIISSPRVPQREQIKEFEPEIRVKVYTILDRLYQAGVQLAGPGIMSQQCGFRVSEATGLEVCSVLSLASTYDVIWIDGQEEDGKRVKYPKTNSGIRLNVLTDEAHEFVCRQMQAIELSGVLLDHPDGHVPLFPAEVDRPLTYQRSEKLSALLHDILRLAGCDDAYLEAAQQVIDKTHKGPAQLRAHQLRHDWYSRQMNECGIPQDYVDTMGGHSIGTTHGEDRVSADTIRWIQAMQRRAPYDIDLAQDPAYKPVVCSPDEQISVSDGAAVIVQAERDGVYRIAITTREPHDKIFVTAPSGSLQTDTVTINERIYRSGLDNGEIVIGPRIPPEQLRAWKDQAYAIDIEPLIKKYCPAR